jgi:hypothetical protein
MPSSSFDIFVIQNKIELKIWHYFSFFYYFDIPYIIDWTQLEKED